MFVSLIPCFSLCFCYVALIILSVLLSDRGCGGFFTPAPPPPPPLFLFSSFLPGMPELKLGLNDKLMLEQTGRNFSKGKAVEMEDIKFHQCVRLARFENDRTISFIPPDGEFELMRYRVTDNVNLPFRIVPAVQEDGKTSVSISLKCSAQFSYKLFATNVIIKVPVPNCVGSPK